MRKTSTITLAFLISICFSQIIEVGSGSYTLNFPGTDQAGRNSYPSGYPQTTGPASLKHPPTNDWWSALIKNDHVSNLFNYPLALKTTNQGLVTSYIPWGVYDDQEPILIGVSGLNSSRSNIHDFTDWTVTMDWSNNGHNFRATSGIGMPFVYFTKGNNDIAEIEINLGDITVDNEKILISNARNDADFIIYAPVGSTWQQNGIKFTSDLNGENYWSLVMIPQSENDLTYFAQEYQKYAYVFPINTTANWVYNQVTSELVTEYLVEVEVKEGSFNHVFQGLLPHQWNNLDADSPAPDDISYSSVRGEMKMLNGNFFKTKILFRGILPTLPYLANYSPGFNPAELENKISQIENDQLATWTDSYNEGQVMNRLVQTARIADQSGDFEARDIMVETIKDRLEDWLTASNSEVAFLFYYNSTWSTLIGYPAGHGQDNNINDHHFHWGYFIHAASFIEQMQPGWALEWGEMVNELVWDAASPHRDDEKYPYLRSFSPYSGHCWANGFATFPQGNDQESTSESMQFNSALIHWGSLTGNNTIRDLGVYLYVTEQTAVEEYWFDMYERNLNPSHPYSLVSRVWGNSYDNGTFWTNDIAASYGIELYPIHGGSLYLAHNESYVQTLWDEISINTGILNNEVNPNLWHDVFWKYLSFIDPETAIELYNSNPNRELKFGISDAQTYYWLHGMNALGKLRSEVYSNYPISASFDKEGVITYAAHNYSDEVITVTFSDGFQLDVPPNQMTTNRGSEISGIISSDFYQAYVNGSINVTIESDYENISRVEIYDGENLAGETASYPFTYRVSNLSPGLHNIYAKLFSGYDFGLTNIINIQVGEQKAYTNEFNLIPGVIESGNYDSFDGSIGQGVTYFDMSQENYGGFRPQEYVDSEYSNNEGATLGWISSGEWLEYSIKVESAGFYNISFRLASGNPNGGGPFHLEIDNNRLHEDIYIESTGDWYNWITQEIQDIPLNQGEHTLRLVMSGGEFNIGKMQFSYSDSLNFSPPVANAGEDIVVVLPSQNTVLDGTLSFDNDNENLIFNWSQVYGPSFINFADNSSISTDISNLEEGVYKIKLTVSDGTYQSSDFLLVFVSATSNLAPTVVLDSPNSNSSYFYGATIPLIASASDIDGEITLVEFFNFENKIGEDNTHPYQYDWIDANIGIQNITAHATDDGGLTSISITVDIEVLDAPSCFGGPDNGHYTYEFSDDANNPTITFIPGAPHVGDPTCILYYSTEGTPPGYHVTPNIPFQIIASEGDQIQFYYTYSYNGLDQNTSQNMHSYIVGSCNILEFKKENNIPKQFSLKAYPNPFNPLINIDYSLSEFTFIDISIYDIKGQLIKNLIGENKSPGFYTCSWDSRNNNGKKVSAGLYFINTHTKSYSHIRKIVLVK